MSLYSVTGFLALNSDTPAREDGVDLRFSWDTQDGLGVMVSIDPQGEFDGNAPIALRHRSYNATPMQFRALAKTLLALAEIAERETHENEGLGVNEVS